MDQKYIQTNRYVKLHSVSTLSFDFMSVQVGCSCNHILGKRLNCWGLSFNLWDNVHGSPGGLVLKKMLPAKS